ncbi:hypothetical protein, partial [Ancrocorticia populi]|uniref:hypothetical protein n=1 Tax=Ancrocorticia populi TaxID=2175228 RepID=UPI003F9CAA35
MSAVEDQARETDMPIAPPTDAEYAAQNAGDGAVRVLQIVQDLLRGQLVGGSEAACIDQIRLLEDIKSAAAWAQILATEEFRHRRDQAEADAG